MRFTLSGEHDGRMESICFDHGSLVGAEPIVERFEAEFKLRRGDIWLGNVSVTGGLENPLLVLALGYIIFGSQMKAGGDVPQLPAAPPTAIC